MPMTFPEYETYDGLGLAHLVQQNIISPTELLEAAIERIELFNPKINAVIYKMYDQARAAIKTGLPRGLFYGVPILLKDLTEYAGTPMQMGSRFTKGFMSTQDSEVVARLKQSGVSILGKTNLPELGLGDTTEPVAFGPTRNPWDLTRSSAGSSGGSAAAVAARMVPIAHAGDGGGSIRLPAAYCGIFGLKPTRGRTPIGPVMLRVWQGMCVEHVLTRSVRDSAAMLDVLAGPELGSPISQPKPVSSYLRQLEQPLTSLRIGLIHTPFFPAAIDPEYHAAVKTVAKYCQVLGHEVREVELKINSEEVAAAFFIVMAAEIAMIVKKISEKWARTPAADELEEKTKVIAHAGTQFSAADLAWAIQIIDMTGRQFAEFYQNIDMLLMPTTPIPAQLIGAQTSDRWEQFLLKILSHFPYLSPMRKAILQESLKKFSFISFTALFNITGQPAMSVPLCWDKNGLPIGVQFAGRFGEDGVLLQLARQLEQAYPWEEKRPH